MAKSNKTFQQASQETIGHTSNPELRRKMSATARALRLELEKNRVLRPAQKKIVAGIADALDAGYRAIYIDIPGSAGKTVIASQFVRAIFKRLAEEKTLFATRYIHLTEQAEESFETFSPELPVGIHHTHIKDTRLVTLTTHRSFLDFFKPADRFGYVVIDEAHHVLSENMLAHLNRFTDSIWIAMTATPAYSEDKNLAKHFYCAYRMSMEEAIEENLVCGFRNILVVSEPINLQEIERGVSGDYDPAALERAVNKESRNMAAVDFYRYGEDAYTGERILGKKTVIHCAGVQQAEAMTALLRQKIDPSDVGGRVPAAVVHYKIPINRRREILQAHADGEIPILVNAHMVGEGHNDPGIEVVMNLVPTLSPVKAYQRGARVQRLDPDNPDKIGLVVDFLDQSALPKGSFATQIPILYGEVAGGNVMLRPSKDSPPLRQDAKTAVTRKRKPGHLLSEEVKVLWDEEEVRSILNQRRAAREANKALDASECPPIMHLVKAMRSSHLTVRPILMRLKPVKGKTDVMRDPAKQVEWRVSRKTIPPRLHIGEYDQFKKTYGFDVPAGTGDEWLVGTDIAALYSTEDANIDRHTVMAILKRLEPMEGNPGFMQDPKKGGVWRVELRRVNRHATPCLHVDDLERFASHYHLNALPKTEEWLAPEDVERNTGISVPVIYKIQNRLEPVGDVDGYMYDPETGKSWRMDYFKSGPGLPLCLHASESDAFAKTYKSSYPDKTSEWLSTTDLAKSYDCTFKVIMPVLNRLEPLADKPGYMKDPLNQEKVWRVEIRWARTKETRCLHVSEGKAFGDFYKLNAPAKTAEWLSAVDIHKEVGVGIKSVQAILRRLNEPGKDGKRQDSLTLTKWRVENRKTIGSSPLCLHRDELTEFVRTFRTSRWYKTAEP